jgi:hypothetical protein
LRYAMQAGERAEDNLQSMVATQLLHAIDGGIRTRIARVGFTS